jgi:hypothetical protein
LSLAAQSLTKTQELPVSGSSPYKKKHLEKVEDMVLVGNSEEIFNDSGQQSCVDIHLPAKAASVTHRIAFGPNTVKPVPRLKSQTPLY